MATPLLRVLRAEREKQEGAPPLRVLRGAGVHFLQYSRSPLCRRTSPVQALDDESSAFSAPGPRLYALRGTVHPFDARTLHPLTLRDRPGDG